jgi:hypothetical protein
VTKYVFDSSVLIGHPEVLAKGGPDAEFIMPDFLFAELAVNGSDSTIAKLRDIIQRAIDEGSLTVISTAPERFSGAFIERQPAKVNDAWLVIWFMQFAKGEADAVLVTDDRDFSPLKTKGFVVLSTNELIERLQRRPALSKEIVNRTRNLVRSEIVTSIAKVAIGVGIGLLGNLSYAWIIGHLAYFGLALGALAVLIVGVTLYWTRGRYPLVYGATEIIVGIVAAVNGLARTDLNKGLDLTIVIQVLGGIYIIVRGLDNAGKGVRGTVLEARWNRIFSTVLPGERPVVGRQLRVSPQPPSAGTAPIITCSG